MIIVKTVADLKASLLKARQSGASIGFAPTMGALHAGHLSLVDAAHRLGNFSVVSIFVNPTQFNNQTDFEKYPITIDRDIELLEKAGAGLLFLPSVAEMYPDGMDHLEQYPLGFLETVLEGPFRPGHFQGVCQVMSRLLDMVQADDLFMGSKDYQQCMVVQKLITLKNSRTRLHTCATLREPGGLAMSSRNMRLSESERQQALAIYQTLLFLQQQMQPGALEGLVQEARERLTLQGFRVDYVALHGADDLQPLTSWDGQMRVVALIAAYLHEVRLIDNLVLNENID